VERYFTHPQSGEGRPPFQYPVLIYNARRDSGIEEKALQSGVKGVFYDGISLDRFIDGILEILDGGYWFPDDIMAKLISRQRQRVIVPVKEKSFLSSREVEILEKLAGGLTNDEIGEELHISLCTVKTHLQNIYRKIKVNSRTQAIIWSAKNLAKNQIDLSWLGKTHVERKAAGNH
jgi:DNA-binding NarL/FixJ family response regulator